MAQDTVIDVEGNSYAIKVYQSTIWMTENLQVTKDGSGKDVTYFYPNDDECNKSVYGLLYDFDTALKVCPTGWRLPNNEEWESLLDFRSNDASKFKDPGYWAGEDNSNLTGFSIRPTGYGNNGDFDNFFQSKTYFWSGTKDNDHDAWTYIIEIGKNTIRKAPQHPTYAYSVRCVRKL